MRKLFEILNSISPDERQRVLRLFFFAFGNAAAYVIARTVADSAFLYHIGPERLPPLYMVSAGVVALATMAYGRLLQRFDMRTMVMQTLAILAVLSALTPTAMRAFSDSLTVFAMVYLVAQVRGSLGMIQFATFLNEQFDTRQQVRLVGVLNAGATIAGFLVGTGIGLIAKEVNVGSLMYVTAIIDLCTLLPVFGLRRPVLPPSTSTPTEQPRNAHGLRDAFRSPLVASISAVVVSAVVVATLVEYQWKASAAHFYSRDEQSLTQYFGYFYGVVYLATWFLQMFVTGRTLRRRGMLFGLCVFPLTLLFATCGALLTPATLLLIPMTISKGCDTLKRSMSDPSIQVAYRPLELRLRRQAITFVSGIAKPFAEALAAVILVIATPRLSDQYLSILVILLIFVWLAAAVRVWRQFALTRKHRPSS